MHFCLAESEREVLEIRPSFTLYKRCYGLINQIKTYFSVNAFIRHFYFLIVYTFCRTDIYFARYKAVNIINKKENYPHPCWFNFVYILTDSHSLLPKLKERAEAHHRHAFTANSPFFFTGFSRAARDFLAHEVQCVSVRLSFIVLYKREREPGSFPWGLDFFFSRYFFFFFVYRIEFLSLLEVTFCFFRCVCKFCMIIIIFWSCLWIFKVDHGLLCDNRVINIITFRAVIWRVTTVVYFFSQIFL